MPEHDADTNSQSSDSKQPIETSSISQNPTFIIAKVRYFIYFIKILMNNLVLIKEGICWRRRACGTHRKDSFHDIKKFVNACNASSVTSSIDIPSTDAYKTRYSVSLDVSRQPQISFKSASVLISEDGKAVYTDTKT